MFDLTYTAVILQNVLIVTKIYTENRSEVSRTFRSELVSGHFVSRYEDTSDLKVRSEVF